MWMLVAALAAAGIIASQWSLRPYLEPIERSNTRTSFVLLVAYNAVTLISFQVRTDTSALFTEGLSSQNRLQAAVVLTASGWAFFLITSRRILIVEAFARQRTWITLLICWYAAAALWAITPALSVYRVIELAMLWVLTMHVFSGPGARRRLTQLMVWMMFSGIVSGIISLRSLEILGIGAIRSNVLAPIAATLALFGIDALLRHGATALRVVAVLLPLWLFLMFDSLATAGALLLAIGVFFTWKVRNVALRASGMIAIVVGALVLVSGLQLGPATLLTELGGAYGRETQGIDSWTGRVPLWQFLLGDVGNHPLGFGLGADRLISLRDTTNQIGWKPLHAHSGYLSALYAGGLFAFVLVVAVTASTFRFASRLDSPARPLAFAVVTLLAVNNLTIVGVGGVSSTSWLLVMAIIASRARVFEFTEPEARHTVAPTRPDRTSPAANGSLPDPTDMLLRQRVQDRLRERGTESPLAVQGRVRLLP